MKISKYILFLAVAGVLPSCVEDETNYDIKPVNEVLVSGIEDTYYGMAYNDVIEITPDVTGSLNGEDLSNYEYAWYRCGTNHVHDTISTEKNLNWLANAAPGTHSVYFSVTDKSTGYELNTSTRIELSSPFTRGFLIFGNRPHTDKLVGLDMLTMVAGRTDTVYAKDVFDNSERQLRNAKALMYTGSSRANRFYLQTEDATYNPTFWSDFETLGDEFNDLGLIECLESHKVPMKLMDVGMREGVHTKATLTTMPRAYLTEDQAFGHRGTEKMNQPLNRYTATSNIYFKFYPYLFYNTRRQINSTPNSYADSYTPIIVYDTDNDCFSYYTGTALGFTHMSQIPNTVVLMQNGIYMMNQPNGRTLVYGENDYRPSNGRCNAIMKDNDDNYMLYRFVAMWKQSMFTGSTLAIDEPYSCELDVASMTGFMQREHIFFASGAVSLIYYSVGNTLYAYDYVAKRLASKQFDSPITYLAPEVVSISGDVSNYWVATFDGDKGHLYKMKTVDNPDKIEFIDLPNQNWEVDLEVKSVLWKSGMFY